jgi:hypothetical protein
MNQQSEHHPVEGNHTHKHSIACGHTKIKHEDHIDYVHNGHLHHEHEGHWDECKIPVSEMNPAEHKPTSCGCNHGDDCGHEMVPHGDHMDYLVNGRLHHVHDGHCDDHGPIEIVQTMH